MMDAKKTAQQELMALAQQTKHYCNLLIRQCNNWLPEGQPANRKTAKNRLDKTTINKPIN